MTDKERIERLEAHVERLVLFSTQFAALLAEQGTVPMDTLRTALDDAVGPLDPNQDQFDRPWAILFDRLQY